MVKHVDDVRDQVQNIDLLQQGSSPGSICVLCFPTSASSVVFVDSTKSDEVLPFIGNSNNSSSSSDVDREGFPQSAEGIEDKEEAQRVEEGLADPECAPAVREALELMWRRTQREEKKKDTALEQREKRESSSTSTSGGGSSPPSTVTAMSLPDSLWMGMEEEKDAKRESKKLRKKEQHQEEEEEDLLLLTLDPSTAEERKSSVEVRESIHDERLEKEEEEEEEFPEMQPRRRSRAEKRKEERERKALEKKRNLEKKHEKNVMRKRKMEERTVKKEKVKEREKKKRKAEVVEEEGSSYSDSEDGDDDEEEESSSEMDSSDSEEEGEDHYHRPPPPTRTAMVKGEGSGGKSLRPSTSTKCHSSTFTSTSSSSPPPPREEQEKEQRDADRVFPSVPRAPRHLASKEELLQYSRGIRSCILFFMEQHHPEKAEALEKKKIAKELSNRLHHHHHHWDDPNPSNASSMCGSPVASFPFLSPSTTLLQIPSTTPTRNGASLEEAFDNKEEEEEEEEVKEERRLLGHLRGLANCDTTVEQLQELRIGQVVGYLLQSPFPARVQVLAKAILDYWFASLESSTREFLLDTTDVGNCSVESTIGEEEEDRGLGDPQMKDMSSLEVVIYYNFIMGMEEEMVPFIEKEKPAPVPSSILASFPYDDNVSVDTTSTSTTTESSSAPRPEGVEVTEENTLDKKEKEEQEEEEGGRKGPPVDEEVLRRLCAEMESAILSCEDVDIRVAVLNRLSEQKALRNALLEGSLTPEELVKKEEEVALGVSSPLYNMNSPCSPLSTTSSGDEGSPTSFGATTQYQCPGCGERNAFRTMYSVSAHDNFPTLLHCRNCGNAWSY